MRSIFAPSLKNYPLLTDLTTFFVHFFPFFLTFTYEFYVIFLFQNNVVDKFLRILGKAKIDSVEICAKSKMRSKVENWREFYTSIATYEDNSCSNK